MCAQYGSKNYLLLSAGMGLVAYFNLHLATHWLLIFN